MRVRWGSAGMRNGVKSEKSQRRESILDLHSSVLIIMKFCYCWSLFCRGQSKGRRPKNIWCMDNGYLHLEEAYNLYSSFSEFSCPNKQAFRDKLLDPHHGLPVYKESSARLFGLVMKEKCFFVSIMIYYQLQHIMSILCRKISTPLTLCTFSKLLHTNYPHFGNT